MRWNSVLFVAAVAAVWSTPAKRTTSACSMGLSQSGSIRRPLTEPLRRIRGHIVSRRFSAPRNRRGFESCHFLIEANSGRDDIHSDSGARSLAQTHVQIENRPSTEVFHHSEVASFSRQV